MKTNFQALPWVAGTYSTALIKHGDCIKSGDDTIADVYGGPQLTAFIVRACNTHKALVSALRECAEVFARMAISGDHINNGTFSEGCRLNEKLARDALALVDKA